MPLPLPISAPGRTRRQGLLSRGAAPAIAITLAIAGSFTSVLGAATTSQAPADTNGASTDEDTRRRIDELERKIDELTRQLAEARASKGAVPADRLAELERRLDVLAAEVEKLRAGSPAAEAPLAPGHGLGPAASKIYGKDRGVSIGGYGEALYQNF